MKTFVASLVVGLVLLLPRTGAPQIVQPAGVPIVYQGSLYYPSGPTVFFDGAMMTRVGTFEGLPIYLDPSRDPVNVVLVPVGRKLMRPYERTQSDIQADLVYPDPPEFPDQPEPPFESGSYFERLDPPPLNRFASPVARSGVIGDAPSPPFRSGPASRGVWIEFGGSMWTPSGPGPERSPRLRMIGRYFDFPVYQEPSRRDRIFVPATEGGPLIQYDLRPR